MINQTTRCSEFIFVISLLLALQLATPARWRGRLGHRVICRLHERQFTPKANPARRNGGPAFAHGQPQPFNHGIREGQFMTATHTAAKG